MPATGTPSQRSTIRCLEADIVPTAISAEMGGAGAVDQPEVVGLVILSAPQPLEFAKVVPLEHCGRCCCSIAYLQAVAPDWEVADGDRRHVFCKVFNVHKNTLYPGLLQTRPS